MRRKADGEKQKDGGMRGSKDETVTTWLGSSGARIQRGKNSPSKKNPNRSKHKDETSSCYFTSSVDQGTS